MHWRRKWQPTPVFLPGESQGWGSLVGCHLWGRTELDTTEVTWQQQRVGCLFSFSRVIGLFCVLRKVCCFCSVDVISDSLQPRGLQHSRLPCPPLSPGVCSDSYSLSWGCYLTVLSSATLFSFCPQSFPSLRSFPMSQLFALGGQKW